MGPDGYLYTSSFHMDGIKRFDPTTGNYVDTFVPATHPLMGEGSGLAFDPAGNLYVSIYNKDHIVKITPAGDVEVFITTSNPTGLGFGPDGNLYVSDFANKNVKRFQPDGTYIDKFVSNGEGGLHQPSYLTFGANGELLVAAGIEVGPDGVLYVSSGTDHVTGNGNLITMFDQLSGDYLGIFHDGAADNRLSFPGSLFFVPQTQVQVFDNAQPTIVNGNATLNYTEDTALSLDSLSIVDDDANVSMTMQLSDPLRQRWYHHLLLQHHNRDLERKRTTGGYQ